MVDGHPHPLSRSSRVVFLARFCVTLLAVAAASTLFGPALAFSKSHEATTRDLVLIRSVRSAWVGPPSYGILGRVRCDAQGDLFLRPITPRQGSTAPDPVVKILANGSVGPTFSATSIPGFNAKHYLVSDFAVDASGGVRIIVRKCKAGSPECGLEVARFGADGAFQSTAKLAGQDFVPEQLAVFPDGRLFVTGWRIGGVAISSVYGPNGNLIARVHLPGDASVHGQLTGSSDHGAGVAFISPGPGGTLLLTRPVLKASLYAIDENGNVISHAPITPPFPNGVPVGVRYIGNGRALLQFATRDPRGLVMADGYFFEVVEAATGKTLGNYRADSESGGILACYGPKQGLEFLASIGGEDGRGSVIRFDSLP